MRKPIKQRQYTSAFVLATQAKHYFRSLADKDRRAAEQALIEMQRILREPTRQVGNVG